MIDCMHDREAGIKKPYISSLLGGVWMVGVRGYIGLKLCIQYTLFV
jgi:hypothetical protein